VLGVQRCTGGAFTVTFRVLSRKNMTWDVLCVMCYVLCKN